MAMANEYNPFEWVNDLRRVADDKLVKQIAEDFRNYNPSPRSSLSPPATVQVVGAGRVVGGDEAQPVAGTGSGWADSPQIKDWRAPGIDYVDAMCDAQDRVDRAARARELIEAAAIKKAEAELAKQPEPTKERKDKGQK
jgi:hypothetical protein